MRSDGSMVGYSGTSLGKKLGVKAGSVVATRRAPANFEALLHPLPEGATVIGDESVDADLVAADLVVAFYTRRIGLETEVADLATSIFPDRVLWVAWPKKASGVLTDLSGDVVRGIGLAAGIVDIKVCAIDDTWSGLKFVHRLENRPG